MTLVIWSIWIQYMLICQQNCYLKYKRVFVKIINIPNEELFSETPIEYTASYFVKIIWAASRKKGH